MLEAWLPVKSQATQYLGLAFYVLAEAIIFIPIFYIIIEVVDAPEVIPVAGIITFFLFLALTVIVFFTRRDFGFLGPFVTMGGFIALGFIAAQAIFGMSLGVIFAVAMVGLASAAILFTTSKLLHEFEEDQYVGASLELFAALALMFWYIIQILLRMYLAGEK